MPNINTFNLYEFLFVEKRDKGKYPPFASVYTSVPLYTDELEKFIKLYQDNGAIILGVQVYAIVDESK